MINRILVPLDGSDVAEAVLPHVRDLAQRLSAQVFFVRAITIPADIAGAAPGIVISPDLLAEQLDSDTSEANRYLASLGTQWRSAGIVAQCETLTGATGQAAAGAIVRYAREHGIDLIAMSTHGRSGLGRLVFGSVAEQVVREAGVPVLLVKPAAKHAKG